MSILDVRSFKGADCDPNRYMVVALAVSKQEAQKFDRERFNLRKLNELEVRIHYQITNSNKFAALENLSCSADINRARENIKEHFKSSAKHGLGLCKLKQYKPWFEEECLCF